jgi:hypothetical protein
LPPAKPFRFSTPEDEEPEPEAGSSCWGLFGTEADRPTDPVDQKPQGELSEVFHKFEEGTTTTQIWTLLPGETYKQFVKRRKQQDLEEDTKVVTAQLEHGLDIQERHQTEPEDYLAQQSAIKAAVLTGGQIPSLPPLIEQEPTPQPSP